MKKLPIILLLCWAGQAWSLDIRVRLFSTDNFDRTTVVADTGDYFLIALDEKLRPIDTILDIFDEEEHKTFHFARRGSRVSPVRGDLPLGSYHGLLLLNGQSYSEFKIEAAGKKRIYYGGLQIRSYDGSLQVVNVVDMEHYVAGVVESEGGHKNSPEFFKAQAVLARTFALKNWQKHLDEGYNLKDDVTSQVYFSKARYQYADEILAAVEATRDTVVVTSECDPILGVFHANSGGYCTNAEDVWLKPIPYLKAKVDTFSLNTGSYEWERKVSKRAFFEYYAQSLNIPNDAFLQKAILNFSHHPRAAYFEYKGRKLKLTRVRRHFNLRSTFFDVEDAGGGLLLLKGHGYGHGVGLSQDGAIEMSNRGYNYRQIINYYYDGVELESIERLRVES